MHVQVLANQNVTYQYATLSTQSLTSHTQSAPHVLQGGKSHSMVVTLQKEVESTNVNCTTEYKMLSAHHLLSSSSFLQGLLKVQTSACIFCMHVSGNLGQAN